MTLIFAVPFFFAGSSEDTEQLERLSGVRVTTEGFHAYLRFEDETSRVVAALTLAELAKAYRNSLLVSHDVFELEAAVEAEERVRFLIKDLELPMRPLRFVFAHGRRTGLAVARALVPGNPMVDPRDVWLRL